MEGISDVKRPEYEYGYKGIKPSFSGILIKMVNIKVFNAA